MHTNVHEHTYTNTLKLTETEAFSHMQQPIYAVVHKRTISLTQMQLHTQSVEVCICVQVYTLPQSLRLSSRGLFCSWIMVKTILLAN